MAISLRPTDGLVTRLLQQQNNHGGSSAKANQHSQNSADQVNISTEARQQTDSKTAQPTATNPYGYKQDKLESQLIQLYAKLDQSEP